MTQYAHKVKSHRPKGSMCMACKFAQFNCSGFDFKHMPIIGKDADGIVIVKCSEFSKPEQPYKYPAIMPTQTMTYAEICEMYPAGELNG